MENKASRLIKKPSSSSPTTETEQKIKVNQLSPPTTPTSPTTTTTTNQSVNKSKIPTRDMKGSTTNRSLNLSPPDEKKFSLKIRSKTVMDIPPGNKGQQNDSIGVKQSTTSKYSISSVNTSTSTIGSPKSHPRGEIPPYLKKMEKNEKPLLESTLKNKKKTFNTLKKKVEEQQTELLSAYKTLREMQMKYNKTTGKETPIEEIKLATVSINNVEEVLVKRDEGVLKSPRPLSLIHAARDSLKLEQIRNKLQAINSSGFNLCQDFFCSFAKLPTGLEQPTGDCSADREVLEVMKSLEATARGMKEQLNTLKDALSELDDVSGAGLSIDPKLTKLFEEKIMQLSQQLDAKKLDLSSEDMIKHETAITELKKQLTDKESLISDKNQAITKLKERVSLFEDQKRDTERQINSIQDELEDKNIQIQKLENEVEVHRSKAKQIDVIMEEISNQNHRLIDQAKREQEVKKQYEVEHDMRLKLESDIVEKENQINKLKDDLEKQKITAALGAGDRSHAESEYKTEVQNLRIKLEKLMMEKACIEKERNDLKKTLDDGNPECSKLELVKSKQEINRLNKTNECLGQIITKLEQSISKKVATIKDLEQKLSNGLYQKELQTELNTLRETDGERKRELEALRCELSKARIEIKQQEETIYMHQRLLRIRNELINSLQEKEATNRCRMHDLYSEITKKSSLLNQDELQMNREISAKAEELQNLFSTLGTKQLEINRQDNIIKMLEENNDKNHRLRVKQEEKIAVLENENAQLKHVLSAVENCMPEKKYLIGLNNFYSNLESEYLESERTSITCDTLTIREHYNLERRRKRSIKIEVKKIFK